MSFPTRGNCPDVVLTSTARWDTSRSCAWPRSAKAGDRRRPGQWLWALCPGQSKRARSDDEPLEPVEASSKGAASCPFLAPGRTGQCQTVHEVIEMYLAQARRKVSPRSYETVSCILRRFDESSGQLTLAECRPFDLQCWLNEHPEYRSEWYRRCVISSIKRAFNWTCEMELIQRNPFAKMRSRGRPQRRRPMTDNEFQTLLRGCDPTFRRFLIFLKFTGCRPGEAAGMRWPDVHFEEGAVVLEEHKNARKTGRPRIIPLVPTVVKLLLWMRSVRRRFAYVRAGPCLH